jgi:DNA invertase Pin-like site-specific DNA recombinase
MQIEAMRTFADARNFEIVREVEEIASGAKVRREREELLNAARRREFDFIIVWKLDRFGRSLPDLVNTLEELKQIGVGFISITESLDFTTPAGRALAGMLSVFAEFERDILRERVKAGIADAKAKGKPHGRPATPPMIKDAVLKMAAQKDAIGARIFNNTEIARKYKLSRANVINILK